MHTMYEGMNRRINEIGEREKDILSMANIYIAHTTNRVIYGRIDPFDFLFSCFFSISLLC